MCERDGRPDRLGSGPGAESKPGHRPALWCPGTETVLGGSHVTAGTEAEGGGFALSGHFLREEMDRMPSAPWYEGETRAERVIYNKRLCTSLCESPDCATPPFRPHHAHT